MTVTDISPHGIWVLAQGEEIFLPYDKFPWFKHGSVEAVLNIEEQAPGHYYWPDLDVDGHYTIHGRCFGDT